MEESTKVKKINRTPIIIAVLFVFAIGAMYVWKSVSERKLRSEYDMQKQEMVIAATSILSSRTEKLLNAVMQPFVWSVRTELLKDNYDQIDSYLTQFVKQDEFNSVMLITPDMEIKVSTDKKLEGAIMKDENIKAAMNTNSIVITKANPDDQEMIISAPVMGFNSKLGTIVVFYKPHAMVLEPATDSKPIIN